VGTGSPDCSPSIRGQAKQWTTNEKEIRLWQPHGERVCGRETAIERERDGQETPRNTLWYKPSSLCWKEHSILFSSMCTLFRHTINITDAADVSKNRLQTKSCVTSGSTFGRCAFKAYIIARVCGGAVSLHKRRRPSAHPPRVMI